jgi:hypothetical protein
MARLVPALALLTVGHKLLVRANQWSRQAYSDIEFPSHSQSVGRMTTASTPSFSVPSQSVSGNRPGNEAADDGGD